MNLGKAVFAAVMACALADACNNYRTDRPPEQARPVRLKAPSAKLHPSQHQRNSRLACLSRCDGVLNKQNREVFCGRELRLDTHINGVVTPDAKAIDL